MNHMDEKNTGDTQQTTDTGIVTAYTVSDDLVLQHKMDRILIFRSKYISVHNIETGVLDHIQEKLVESTHFSVPLKVFERYYIDPTGCILLYQRRMREDDVRNFFLVLKRRVMVHFRVEFIDDSVCLTLL